MKTICEIRDLQKIYHKRVPKMFRDYCESGSWQMQTLRANLEDFRKIDFRQRVARNLENRSLASKLVGIDVKMPVIGAPVGLLGMQHADGEIHAARAFARFGAPFTLSTLSICSLEEVAKASDAPFWFQLYAMRDKDFTKSLIERAKAVDCSALVVTLDLQVLGKRHADVKNGMTAPPKLTLKNLIDMGLHPRWAWNMLKTRNRQFGNIQGYQADTSTMNDLMKWVGSQFDLALSWEDIQLYRDRWKKPLIIKGIMEVEDAMKAAELGADAIVVSNHGGRQLDGAPSAISALPNIVEAVGDRVEIYLDSGVRSGQDALRAIAMGAKAVMIGRAMVYGLGAYGEPGVYRALEILYEEMDISMGFMGHKNINHVSQDDIIIKL